MTRCPAVKLQMYVEKLRVFCCLKTKFGCLWHLSAARTQPWAVSYKCNIINVPNLPFFQELEEEVWYHEGSPELKIARFWIAKYSLPRFVNTCCSQSYPCSILIFLCLIFIIIY